MFFYQSY